LNTVYEIGGDLSHSLFGWLVADGWCWFVLREKYCWLVAGGWFVLREKYCWLVADKPNEQGTFVVQPYRAPASCAVFRTNLVSGKNNCTSYLEQSNIEVYFR
jgi:hypothetical protein